MGFGGNARKGKGKNKRPKMSLKQPSKRTVAPKCNIPTNTLSDRARSGKVLKVTRDGSVVGGGEGKNGGKGPRPTLGDAGRERGSGGQRGPRGAQQVPGPRRPPSPPPAPCALLQKRHFSAVPEGSLKHNGTALPTSPRSMGSSAQGRRSRPPGTPQRRRMNPTRRLRVNAAPHARVRGRQTFRSKASKRPPVRLCRNETRESEAETAAAGPLRGARGDGRGPSVALSMALNSGATLICHTLELPEGEDRR